MARLGKGNDPAGSKKSRGDSERVPKVRLFGRKVMLLHWINSSNWGYFGCDSSVFSKVESMANGGAHQGINSHPESSVCHLGGLC